MKDENNENNENNKNNKNTKQINRNFSKDIYLIKYYIKKNTNKIEINFESKYNVSLLFMLINTTNKHRIIFKDSITENNLLINNLSNYNHSYGMEPDNILEFNEEITRLNIYKYINSINFIDFYKNKNKIKTMRKNGSIVDLFSINNKNKIHTIKKIKKTIYLNINNQNNQNHREDFDYFYIIVNNTNKNNFVTYSIN